MPKRLGKDDCLPPGSINYDACHAKDAEEIARLIRERDEARAAYDQLREDQQRERDEMDQLAVLCGHFEDQLASARDDLVGHMQQWNETYLALQAVEAERDRLRALLQEVVTQVRLVEHMELEARIDAALEGRDA